MDIDMSNYWDDFAIRVSESIEALNNNTFPDLKRLTVHITTACNFNCSYCNMKCSTNHMDNNLLIKIIDEFKDMGGSIIHFTGGEPTLYPQFMSICEYAKSSRLTVSMNSNAFLKINTENVDKLKTSFDSCNSNFLMLLWDVMHLKLWLKI